jgi:hypothetical protein
VDKYHPSLVRNEKQVELNEERKKEQTTKMGNVLSVPTSSRLNRARDEQLELFHLIAPEKTFLAKIQTANHRDYASQAQRCISLQRLTQLGRIDEKLDSVIPVNYLESVLRETQDRCNQAASADRKSTFLHATW